jgi:trimeric autotransporter adhesin
MKKVLTFLSLITGAIVANAQVTITTLGYTQDFNSLDTITTGTGSTNLPTGWLIAERSLGSGTNAIDAYRAGTGSSNTGDTYSFGTASNTERAFGSVASGSNRSRFGLAIINGRTDTITSFTLNFNCEQWRIGDTATIKDTTLFEYSTSAIAMWDTTSLWNSLASCNLTSVRDTGLTANTAIDGNLAANKSAKTGTAYFNLAPGDTLFLRWFDLNILGSDDGLAVDDVNITFSNIPFIKPLLVTTSPADNATNVALGTTNLVASFDRNISIGTGNVYVANITAGTTQTIAASSCTASGTIVTIPGANIASTSNYAVMFDSTCFNYVGNNSLGIYDSTTWNFASVNPYPLIQFYYPFDNSTNITINNPPVAIKYNKAITAGTGNITFKNITDGTQVTYSVPGPQVTIATDTVLINVGTLLYGKLYAFNFDSTCFNNAGYNVKGLYNDTNWNFTTENAPPPPVTSLSESFIGCTNAALAGGFRQVSEAGFQVWRCSNFGRNDSDCVFINGANTTATFNNSDWLISPVVNVNAMVDPQFNFWSKVRFAGNENKEVLLSTNYTSGAPAAATWVTLPINFASIDTTWKVWKGNSLNAYKATPFVVAFKYTSVADSSAANAKEWSVDDISITDGPLSVKNNKLEGNTIHTYYAFDKDAINISIIAEQAQNFTINVFDITGKKVSNTALQAHAGVTSASIAMNNAAKGIYIVSISNANGSYTTKIVK